MSAGMYVPTADLCGTPSHEACDVNPVVAIPIAHRIQWSYGNFPMESIEYPRVPRVCPLCYSVVGVAGGDLTWDLVLEWRAQPERRLDAMRDLEVNGRPLRDYPRRALAQLERWALGKATDDLEDMDRLQLIAACCEALRTAPAIAVEDGMPDWVHEGEDDLERALAEPSERESP